MSKNVRSETQTLQKFLRRERLAAALSLQLREINRPLHLCANRLTERRLGTKTVSLGRQSRKEQRLGAEDRQVKVEKRHMLVTIRVSKDWNRLARNLVV